MADFKSTAAPTQDKTVEWRPVPGYEGLYEVSEFGDVYSLEFRNGRVRFPRRRRMKASPNERGYACLQLSKDNHARHWCVHELVALAFIGPKPLGKDLVAHWDGDPSNNHFTNLRWATYLENEEDKRRHGRSLIGEKNHQSKMTNEQVVEFRRRHANGEKIGKLSREFGISSVVGYKIATGNNYGSIDGPVRPKLSCRGSENGLAKLTDDSVREIRRLHASKEARSGEIARRFGIHPNNVRMIVRRDTWKHLAE